MMRVYDYSRGRPSNTAVLSGIHEMPVEVMIDGVGKYYGRHGGARYDSDGAPVHYTLEGMYAMSIALDALGIGDTTTELFLENTGKLLHARLYLDIPYLLGTLDPNGYPDSSADPVLIWSALQEALCQVEEAVAADASRLRRIRFLQANKWAVLVRRARRWLCMRR